MSQLRYREHAYRQTCWDTGTSLPTSSRPPRRRTATGLVFGDGDSLINALLDIDGVRESTVAIVALGPARAGRRARRRSGPTCRPTVLALQGCSRAVLGGGPGSAPSDDLDGDRFPGGAGQAGQWGEGVSGAVPQFGEGVVRGIGAGRI